MVESFDTIPTIERDRDQPAIPHRIGAQIALRRSNKDSGSTEAVGEFKTINRVNDALLRSICPPPSSELLDVIQSHPVTDVLWEL